MEAAAMTAPAPSLRERQIELENRTRQEAINRFRDALETSQAEGLASTTGIGQAAIRGNLKGLMQAIEWAAATGANPSSFGDAEYVHRRPTDYLPLLRQLPADVTALLTLQAALDACFVANATLAVTARELGAALEREAMVRQFQKQEPEFVAECAAGFRARNARDDIAAEQLLIQMRDKAGHRWEPWDKKLRRALALNLLTAALYHTALFDREFVNAWEPGKSRIKGEVRVSLSAVGRQWWEGAGKALHAFCFENLPMVCPPIPWTGAYGGGYASPETPISPLVKTADKKYLASLVPESMPEVLTAINAVQNTAWKVDGFVLTVAKALWEDGGGVAGLPPAYFAEVIPPRLPDDAAEEDIRARNRKVRELHAQRARIEGRGRRVHKTLQLAERFRGEPIYFPHQLDFRGRMYSMVPVLSPQGNDLEKGLLRFDFTLPIETEEQACWLAIHGANSFGKDKLPLQERVDWIEENEANILRAVENPIGSTDWWGQADKPFCFLAFCVEWACYLQARADGRTYYSGLPVSLDGTCNGLQHLSAMTRDRTGGEFVNLTDHFKPADIYQRVADQVIETLHRIAEGDPESVQGKQAAGWLSFGIDRKLTKRTVMVVPYGGTTKSCREYVRAAVLERIEAGLPCPFERGRELLDASTMLANTVWQSLSEVLSGARVTMKWLQQCTSVLSKHGLPVRWTTPTGFPVLQAYKDTRETVIKYGPKEQRFKATFHVEEATFNKHEQRNGISPNFTHSLDAAHMTVTICEAEAMGIQDFAMVHDSYGTHAANIPRLCQLLRASFASIYDGDPLSRFESDVKAALPEGVKVPERPEYGSWSPAEVLEASFFFH